MNGERPMRRFVFVAAALLAMATLLSACGAFDAHAAAPDAAGGSYCTGFHDEASANRPDPGPAGHGGEVPLLASAFARAPVRSSQPAAPRFTSTVLPPSSFYARSARILR
jgi:hypothetical protein